MAKRWHNSPNPEAQPNLDSQALLNSINNNDKYVALYRSTETKPGMPDVRSRDSFAIKSKTVKSLIKNGYLNTDLWRLNNKIKPVRIPVDRRGLNGKDYRIEYQINSCELNWTIDLDNVKPNSIEEMREDLKNKCAPTPQEIVKTSDHRFHIKYTGYYWQWTAENRLSTALLVAGCRIRPKTISGCMEALRAGGVDTNYFSQPVTMSKTRVPGSINTKNGFVCEGWTNQEYSSKIAIEQLNQYNPSKITSITEHTITKEGVETKRNVANKRKFVVYHSKTQLLIDKLKEIFPKWRLMRVEKVADFFMNRLNWGMKGTMNISQPKLALLLGITQPAAHKIVKKIIDSGIIRKVGVSIRQSSSGFGSVIYGFTANFIKQIMNYGKKEKVVSIKPKPVVKSGHDLNKPYTPGKSNNQKLADIRCMYMDYGYTETETARFIYQKFSERTDKVFSRKQIEAEVSWYCGYLYDKYPRARDIHGVV